MVVTAMVVPEPRDQTIALVDVILVWTKRTTLRRVVLFDAKSQSPRTPNARFLRHRPKRSERCLNYWRFYQRHPRVAKQERCAEGLSVKTMLGDPEAAWQARFHLSLTRIFWPSTSHSVITTSTVSPIWRSDSPASKSSTWSNAQVSRGCRMNTP